MGFDLPTEIRESLRIFLFGTETYRKNVPISAHISHFQGKAVVEMKIDATVVAAKRCTYRQWLAGESHEKRSLKAVSLTSKSNPKLNYSLSDVTLKDKKDERGVVEWKGTKLSLKQGDTLDVHFHYIVEKQPEDFYILYFGSPNIHPVLWLTCADGIEADASKPDRRNGNEYIYEKVFLAADHINIRWWNKQPSKTSP